MLPRGFLGTRADILKVLTSITGVQLYVLGFAI